jgi:hypothetical protein
MQAICIFDPFCPALNRAVKRAGLPSHPGRCGGRPPQFDAAVPLAVLDSGNPRVFCSLLFALPECNVAGSMKKGSPSANADGRAEPDGSAKAKKATAPGKAAPGRSAKAAKTPAAAPAEPSLKERMAEAKKLEALDRAKAPAAPAKAKKSRATPLAPATAAEAAPPLRNSDFPNTYIEEISVRLNDPDHSITLTWTGPQSAAQETGPFHSSPGAGLKGLNCDDTATSRRSGSKCTPKGTFKVSGFADHLNSDARATYVTFFVQARGIGLHYFPSVPKYAASHGCVRLEVKRVAQLIQSNSRVDLTSVLIDGTWTKPPKQW